MSHCFACHASDGGPRARTPAAPPGDLGGVPASWLLPGPVSAVGVVLEGEFSVSVSLTVPFK